MGLRVARQIEQDGLDMWSWNEWRKSRKMRVSPKAMSNYDPARNAGHGSVSKLARTYDGPVLVDEESALPVRSGL
jgi:hypothetical protein